jgi:hypothetical protein
MGEAPRNPPLFLEQLRDYQPKVEAPKLVVSDDQERLAVLLKFDDRDVVQI